MRANLKQDWRTHAFRESIKLARRRKTGLCFCMKRWLATIVAAVCSASAMAGLNIRGFLDTHDPSTMIPCKSAYYVFYTGLGISSKVSTNKVFWSPGPPVLAHAPAWTTNAAPGFDGTIWAPDVFFWNGRYYLYYAVSSFGSQVSAIGLVTNATLDPSDPAYHWSDQGPVIQSVKGSAYNTIDPCFCRDGAGNLWMAFGSYWNGIYLTQLNPQTGLRIAANSPIYHLAYNSSIEASYLFRRGGYYYLFVNWGSCCSGVNSSYNIRMGRATSITGPYLDRNGVNLVANGGSLFLEGSGKFTGPGHVGIMREDGVDWLTYHYYDAGAWSPSFNAFGASKLDLMELNWTADNWPVATNAWEAAHEFRYDARDENGQYYGLLLNGAATQPEALHGRVLNLNGTNQYAQLPVGEAYGRTYEAVVKWNGGAPWQRVFDFGTDTNHWLFLTPNDGGAMQFAITDNRQSYVQTIEAPSALPSNVWVNVAVTLDGTNGILYVNGVPAATNSAMTTSPVDVHAQTNYLGRSRWPADPYFNGQIASFHAFGKALTADEITAPQPVISSPDSGAVFYPGTAISFAGSARDFMAIPLGDAALSWTITLARDGVTNTVAGPFAGVTNGSFSIPASVNYGTYCISLTATDGEGRQAAASRLVSAANPPPVLSSYYPFRADASDASGRFNGALNGGAAIQSDPTRGNVLSLSGAGQYVSLPAGASAFRTFMGWVKWNGGAAWQRVFDFGNDTNGYTMLTPMAANGKCRRNISIDSTGGEEIEDAPAALPTGVWTHVAVATDGQSGTLYINGSPAATNLSMDLISADVGGTNNFFGKSNWPLDPYFNGEFSSFRLFSTALTAAQIVAPIGAISQPAFGALYQPGDAIAFAGSASDFYDAPIDAASLSWTVEYRLRSSVTVVSAQSGVSSGVYTIPASGVGASSGFYRFNMVATDSVGRASTNYVDVFPASTATGGNEGSFYSFDSDASDSSGVNNGTLNNGAGSVSDATRGKVLNLSGASQYASLPAGAGGFETFSGWVKWGGGNAWQRIFDFGNGVAQWAFLTPLDASGKAECSITGASAAYQQTIEAPNAFPINAWTHVAVVFDGRQGILYVNGQAVAVNNSVNLLPSDFAPANCWFGRSQYSSDPYFRGRIDSFALNSQALPLACILGEALPVAAYNVSAAGIQFSWPSWSGEFGLYSAASLAPPVAWTLVAPTAVSNGVATAQAAFSEGARFFEIRPQ